MSEELKPCPFCGGDAEFSMPEYPLTADCEDAGVRCSACDAVGPLTLIDMGRHGESDWPRLRAEAIAAWNRRASPTPEGQGGGEDARRSSEWLRAYAQSSFTTIEEADRLHTAANELDRLSALLSSPRVDGELDDVPAKTLERVIERVLMDVCELPDRSSPDDQPEMMLVTGEELDMILKRHLGLEDRALSLQVEGTKP